MSHSKITHTFLLSTLFGLLLQISLLSAQDHLSDRKYYFYKGADYGSEAVFNPVNVFINEGYGIIQLEGLSRDVSSYPYRESFRNVVRSLSNPFKTISRRGYADFFGKEIFPLSFRAGGGGQWAPNYQLHMIGGGMVFASLEEWYAFHGIEHSALMALATVTATHLLNETIENNRFKGYNSDAVADFYFFDVAGILLYRHDSVKRFFAETLNLRSWIGQAGFMLNDGTLQNNGQFFSIKYQIPKTENWQLFYYFGLNNIWGLSRKLSDGNAISFGAGIHAKELIELEGNINVKTVSLSPNAGVFYDRNGSLLFSGVLGGPHDSLLKLNIYPGVVKIASSSPGLWAGIDKDWGLVFGLNLKYLPGLGFSRAGN